MEQQNQQPIREKAETKPPVKTNWKLLAMLIILWLVVAIFLIWGYIAKNTEFLDYQYPVERGVPITQQPKSIPSEDTSTWQTYRNERKEGDSYSLIAINLPSDWEINTSLPFQTYLQAHSPESEFRISLDIRNENEIIQGKNEITGDFYETTLLEAREKLWKKSYNSAFLESINMEVMQGEFTYVPESGWHYIFTDIRASPYIYMITLAEIDPQQDEVSDPTRLLNDQILSTFRFVEKSVRKEIPQDKVSCEAQRGKWSREGLAQSYMCVFEYSDGGKSCVSSDECQGGCIITSYDQKTGTCDVSSSPFGCYVTIEDFRKGEAILCVD